MQSISHASPIDATSGLTLAVPIVATGPDPGETPGIGPAGPFTLKTMRQDRAHGL